jgi:hypothetical protein
LRTGAIRPIGLTPASQPGFPTDATTAPPSSAALYCFKSEQTSDACGISKKDFYVQGIRSSGNNPTDTGYSLKVRVYRADAPFGSLTTGQQSVANSGLGDPKAPLVEMQTEIPPTTNGGGSARQSLCSRLNPGAAANDPLCK